MTNAFGVDHPQRIAKADAKAKKRKETAAYVGTGAVVGGAMGGYVDRASRPAKGGFNEPKPTLTQHMNGGGNNAFLRRVYEGEMGEWNRRKQQFEAGRREFDGIMRSNRMGPRLAAAQAKEAVRHPGKAASAAKTALKTRHGWKIGGAVVGGAYGAAVLSDKRERQRKSRVAKSAFGISKAEWKTIDQRERAQSRNRRRARQASGIGTGAATAAVGLGLANGKTYRQLDRMVDGGTYAFQTDYARRRRLDSYRLGVDKPQGAVRAALGAAKTGAKTAWSGPSSMKGRGRAVVAVTGGGLALAAGAHGAAAARNSYHQKKINERRKANHAKKKG